MDQEIFNNPNSTLASSFEMYDEEEGGMDSRSVDEDEDEDFSDYEEDEEGGEDGGMQRSHEVDVERNVVKYLLESHAAQLGRSGPASQLMSQLGIALPRAPPPVSRPEPKPKSKPTSSDG